MENFIDRYDGKIKGTISCLDRTIFTGIIPGICYPDGMSSLLTKIGFRISTETTDSMRFFKQL